MFKNKLWRFLTFTSFCSIMILSFQEKGNSATFNWGNREIQSFIYVANDSNTLEGSGISNGTTGSPASTTPVEGSSNSMAKAEVNLDSTRTQSKGIFKGSLYTQAGFKTEANGNQPDGWIRGGFKSIAGLRFRQPFTVESDNSVEEISTAIWGKFGIEGQYVFNTVFPSSRDSMSSNVKFDIKIESLNAETWSSPNGLNARYKNDELNTVIQAFDNIYSLATSPNPASNLMNSQTTEFFENLETWWENITGDLGQGINLNGQTRDYNSSLQNKNVIVGDTYTVSMDILFFSSQHNGAYAINDALGQGFNVGVWLEEPPTNAPELPESSTNLGLLTVGIFGFLGTAYKLKRKKNISTAVDNELVKETEEKS